MRIWIGKEKEGSKNQGDMTMFVETPKLWGDTFEFIGGLLNRKYSNTGNPYSEFIDRIYFGAGKVDVKFIAANSFVVLLEICRISKIGITFETSELQYWLNHTGFLSLILKYDVTLVSRADAKPVNPVLTDILKKVVYKIDNGKECMFTNYREDSKNSIEEVKDGQYAEDQLIFSDYKGEKNND